LKLDYWRSCLVLGSMKAMRRFVLSTFILALFGAAPDGDAQTLKGVFGSDVKAGAQAIEYRFGYTDDRGFGVGGAVQRFHYQQAVSDRLQFRGVLFQRDLHGGGYDFRGIRLETLYQLLEDEDAGFDSALRLDLHAADGDDQPGFARIGWGTEWMVSGGWSFRSNVMLRREVGPGSVDDFSSEVRWRANWSGDGGSDFGMELFNSLGFWDAMGSFDEQDHLLGPYVKGEIGPSLTYQVQVLLGLSKSAIDEQFRISLAMPL